MIDVQECKTRMPKKFDPLDWIVQRKWDGTRIIASHDEDGVRFIGKSWITDYANFYPNIINDIAKLGDSITLDGELVFIDTYGREKFFTAASIHKTMTYTPVYKIFDIIEHNGDRLSRCSQLDRTEYIKDNIIDTEHINIVPYESGLVADDFFARVLSEGGEGIVYKKVDETYKFGSRLNWIKRKRSFTEDCFIIGVTHGTGARVSTFGALILGQFDQNGNIVHVCNTSGFTNTTHKQLCDFVFNEESYPISIKGAKKTIAPKKVVEVEFMNRTDDGKLRQPRFLRIRHDKTPADCRTEFKSQQKQLSFDSF